jgi:hypothetical protein
LAAEREQRSERRQEAQRARYGLCTTTIIIIKISNA